MNSQPPGHQLIQTIKGSLSTTTIRSQQTERLAVSALRQSLACGVCLLALVSTAAVAEESQFGLAIEKLEHLFGY